MALLLVFFITFTYAQNCVTGCNGNAFLHTSDPNTIEYDNFISGFHSSIIKQKDGNFLIYGQNTNASSTSGDASLYKPTLVHPDNGFKYNGTPLKMALGSQGYYAPDPKDISLNRSYDQYALLTTEGLYMWGSANVSGNKYAGIIIHNSIKPSFSMEKITTSHITNANQYGLPPNVTPESVKMLFGTYSALVITTCTGEAWVLSWQGNKNGDGTGDSATELKKWHRVKTNATGNPYLTGVVAVRGHQNALMALTDSGEIYTWGDETYLGDNSGIASRVYATKMKLPTLPVGVKPKMIGLIRNNFTASNPKTGSTYYLLTTDGQLFSLGDNKNKQLGDYSTDVEKKSWVNVKFNSTTNMSNIAWISPNEHTGKTHATVTALTTDGKLWGWGRNDGNMLGAGAGNNDPMSMYGNLNATDKILAVETGGHTVSIFKDCQYRLGYIGHEVFGSYGNNHQENFNATFQFNSSAFKNLCAIPLPPYPDLQNIVICPNTTANLLNGLIGSVPAGYTLQWWTTPHRTPGTQVTNPTQVGPGTYYAFFISTGGGTICTNLEGASLVVTNSSPTDPEFANCHCTKPPTTGTPAGYTKVGITVQQKQAAWPENIPNGWIALESKEKGMVITRVQNSNTITDTKEGMLIYDTNAKCVKLYNGSIWKCIEKSCND
ncbi:hypothetical protein ACVFVN_01315 [Soonwooa purpurea]